MAKISSNRQAAGWIATIAISAAAFLLARRAHTALNQTIFVLIFSAAMSMWIFRLVEEFIPCIFCAAGFLILDLAPARVVMSGFTSDSFFMAMSFFGLSAVFLSSGLLRRLILVVLRRTPPSRIGYSIAFFLIGFAFTLVFPTANGRIIILIPIAMEICAILGYPAGGPAATEIAVSAFFGATWLSSMIMTSKTINFVVVDLLPDQVKHQFSWLYWAYASLGSSAVLLLLYAVMAALVFRNAPAPRLSREKLDDLLRGLGPLHLREWCALGGIVALGGFVLTSSLHKIEISWLSLAILFVFLALGFLSPEEFQKKVNWNFLLYLGGLVGIAKTMSFLGLDARIGLLFSPLGEVMKRNFFLFVILLFAVVAALRIAIPNNIVVAQLAVVLFPVARTAGVNPWVIGYLLLLFSDGWVAPYQCTYYLQMEDVAGERPFYDQRLFLRFNAASNLLRLVGVLIALPYWKWLGIL